MSNEAPGPDREPTPGEQRLIKAVDDFRFLGEDQSYEIDAQLSDGGLPRPVTRIELTHYDNAVTDEMPLTLAVELEYRLTQDELVGLVSMLLMALPKRGGQA